MCGICGVAWHEGNEPVSEEVIRKMTAVLAHRGPDDAGYYRSTVNQSNGQPGAAFGFRRLSIIDLAGGHQPLANENNSIWIVFNGEIYNYRELRTRLKGLGHKFCTDSDSETIVHAYEQYGIDCVDHLRGMFAFAIWDDDNRQLFLARDRLGQKPLFYREEKGRLWFASELKSLLQVPSFSRTLNPSAIDDYFTYQYVPDPACIFQEFSKLPAAHRAVFKNGQLQIDRYWTPPYDDDVAINDDWLQSSSDWTPSAWRAKLEETLSEAVRLRLRSDVPLGAFLSGGIDSTIITGLMQKLTKQTVKTFSIGFPVKKFDETAYARQAAQHLGTDHHEKIVEPDALSILPKLIWHYDEPFSDSSAIPTMYLAEMTRQHVTVALSGDGGDELFAGYDRYRAVRIGVAFDKLPRLLKKLVTARIWQKFPASIEQKSFRRRLKRLLEALDQPPERRYLRWISIMDEHRRRALYTPEFAAQLADHDSAACILEGYSHSRQRDFITRTTCADLLTYLPFDILKKVDIASMAYSLECRSPFLDRRVVELAARMPMALKQNRRKGKLILVETFADLLPTNIQTRPKMGFGVPLDHWFRDELKEFVQDILLGETASQRNFFNRQTVEQLIREHQDRIWDHSYRLWALLCFELWLRTYVDRIPI